MPENMVTVPSFTDEQHALRKIGELLRRIL